MVRFCKISRCRNQAEFTCKCNEGNLICDKHLKEHLLLKGNHQIESIITVLNEKKKQRLVSTYRAQLISLKKLIDFSKKLSEEMISYIIKETDNFIKKIYTETKKIKEILKSSLEKNFIDKEDSSFFNYHVYEVNDFEMYSNQLKKKISCIYDLTIRMKSIQDNILFFDNGNKLKVINLESLNYVSSSLDLPQRIKKCAAVSLGQDRFLIYGSEYYPNGIVRILNFRNGFVDCYPDYESCNQCGMCLKRYSVYVFGGDDPLTDKCKKLNLKTMEWSDLTLLPNKAGSTCAIAVDKMIYITGYQCSEILRYDIEKNKFNSVLNITKDTHKFMFEDWLLVSGSSLYKFEEFKVLTKKQSVNLGDISLRVFKGFRRHKYIYIVFNNNKIYRIDTEDGKIEEINFS